MTSPGRRLSGLERIWLMADRLAPPFVNQLVLEAPTGHLDGVDWDAAVAEAARAVPGISVRLRGVLGWTRWAPGPAPCLVRIADSTWDGQCGGRAAFLTSAINPRTGPVAEVVLVPGPTPRLVLRTHHAALDGRGTLLFMEALGRVARGEEPGFIPHDATTDLELARALGAAAPEPVSADCVSPLGTASPAPFGVRWARRRVDGPTAGLLARAAAALASEVPTGQRARVRIDVPVDLRRHRPALRSTGNLTGLIRLPMAAVTAAADPVSRIAEQLRDGLRTAQEARFPLVPRVLAWLPVSLIAPFARQAARRSLATGAFSTSATISNLGRLDLAAFSVPGFAPTRAFFIPPGSPGLPLFLTLTGDAEGVTLCGSAPLALASNGRLEALLDALAARLARPLGDDAP